MWSRRTKGRKGRRHGWALLALLALVLQLVAPLSPMRPMRIDTLQALDAALARLCSLDGKSSPERPAPAWPGHDCQVCITQAVAGLGVVPTTVSLGVPGWHGLTDWHRQPLTAPVLIHVVGVQPRGPPQVGAVVPGNLPRYHMV